MKMDKNKTRPVFLNLLQIRLPIGGVVSILHRASGVLLVLLLPPLLYGLQQSLSGPDEYAAMSARLTTLPGRIVVLMLLWFLAQHFFSGMRHLLFDLDIGLDKRPARLLAWLTFAASVLVVVLAGISL
jgi:succinate dehydrogenase / fumarate reductase cytochrome b subunit